MGSIAAEHTVKLRDAMRSAYNCEESHVDRWGHLGCEPGDHLHTGLSPFYRDAIISVEVDMGEGIGSGMVAVYRDGSVAIYVNDGAYDEYTRVLRFADRLKALELVRKDWHMEYLSEEERRQVNSFG